MTTLSATATNNTITVDKAQVELVFHNITEEIDHSELRVVVDIATLTDDTGLIIASEAALYCEHDTDEAYNDGYAAGAEHGDAQRAEVMRRWHDDNHTGVEQFCYEQPCADLRTARS